MRAQVPSFSFLSSLLLLYCASSFTLLHGFAPFSSPAHLSPWRSCRPHLSSLSSSSSSPSSSSSSSPFPFLYTSTPYKSAFASTSLFLSTINNEGKVRKKTESVRLTKSEEANTETKAKGKDLTTSQLLQKWKRRLWTKADFLHLHAITGLIFMGLGSFYVLAFMWPEIHTYIEIITLGKTINIETANIPQPNLCLFLAVTGVLNCATCIPMNTFSEDTKTAGFKGLGIGMTLLGLWSAYFFSGSYPTNLIPPWVDTFVGIGFLYIIGHGIVNSEWALVRELELKKEKIHNHYQSWSRRQGLLLDDLEVDYDSGQATLCCQLQYQTPSIDLDIESLEDEATSNLIGTTIANTTKIKTIDDERQASLKATTEDKLETERDINIEITNKNQNRLTIPLPNMIIEPDADLILNHRVASYPNMLHLPILYNIIVGGQEWIHQVSQKFPLEPLVFFHASFAIAVANSIVFLGATLKDRKVISLRGWLLLQLIVLTPFFTTILDISTFGSRVSINPWEMYAGLMS